MTNMELAKKILALVREETRLTLEVIHLLREVEDRKLYLEMSYGSLFDFARKFLGYSEGAAMRRIQAMRLLQAVPEAEAEIKSGGLTLSTAAQVENFSRKTGIDRRVAIDRVKAKGTRDAEHALFELAPQAIPEERVRVVSDVHSEIRIVVDAELLAKVDKLKALLSHTDPNMSYADLFGRAVDFMLARVDPEKRKSRVVKAKATEQKSERTATPAPEAQCETLSATATHSSAAQRPPTPGSVAPEPLAPSEKRTIPSAMRTYIWRRDQGRCTFTDASGRRCDSTHLTEIDHIYPWALGGETSVENLRLLCRAHNQFEAEKYFEIRIRRA